MHRGRDHPDGGDNHSLDRLLGTRTASSSATSVAATAPQTSDGETYELCAGIHTRGATEVRRAHMSSTDKTTRARNIDVTSFVLRDGARGLLTQLMAIEGVHSSEVLRRALRAYAAARAVEPQPA